MRPGEKFSFKVLPDGRVYTIGIDFGAPLKIIAERGPYRIVHVPGHTGWSGLGQTRYYQPWYMLIKVGDSNTATMIHECEASLSTWRGILRSLKAELQALAEKEE